MKKNQNTPGASTETTSQKSNQNQNQNSNPNVIQQPPAVPNASAAVPGHSADKIKNLLFQKVGVFIDAENVELSGLKHHERRTDYKKILEKIGDREITRILYYKPEYKEISADFEKFWHGLGGEIKRPAKNADSFIVIDAVTMAEKLDVVILLGGDKDFLPLVWYLKSRGCRVEVWSWPESTSPEFRQAADFYFPLTPDFLVPDSGRRPRGRAAGSSQGNESNNG